MPLAPGQSPHASRPGDDLNSKPFGTAVWDASVVFTKFLVYEKHLLEPLLQTILALPGPRTTIMESSSSRSKYLGKVNLMFEPKRQVLSSVQMLVNPEKQSAPAKEKGGALEAVCTPTLKSV
ncbi:hypothetical protein VNO80_13217 [Phaseolus coccineus]|uniref:Uncharacterized protein n=1 Tax=Phaseolus coccineus TaxID=3886 RepID=A0AAN9RFE9_PHACN